MTDSIIQSPSTNQVIYNLNLSWIGTSLRAEDPAALKSTKQGLTRPRLDLLRKSPLKPDQP
jgi:hypothetical protein